MNKSPSQTNQLEPPVKLGKQSSVAVTRHLRLELEKNGHFAALTQHLYCTDGECRGMGGLGLFKMLKWSLREEWEKVDPQVVIKERGHFGSNSAPVDI